MTISGVEEVLERLFDTDEEEQARAIETVLVGVQRELVEVETKRLEMQQFVFHLKSALARVHPTGS